LILDNCAAGGRRLDFEMMRRCIVLWRSGMGACGGFSINYRDPNAVAALRKHLDRYLKVRPLYTGDFYPLTPYSLDKASWIAWQFHRADRNESLVQACRRPETSGESLTVKLRGLDPEQRYEIENFDNGKEVRTGAEFMRGLDITLREKPSAAVFVLRAIP
jgi:alpha-galactosidase